VNENILNTIEYPSDLRLLSQEELSQLAKELREYIIKIVATKEGHLGASLGVIELTIALHYVFNTPEDLLVWDVGHQAYGHKILTGRKDIFHTNRQLNGISGFPKRSESIYDTFGVGHSSTAISAALGMAIASQLNQCHDRQHIAVVGDASIASGMAFEALNHAGVSNTNILVVLNDNAIGIDPSVGALKEYLAKTNLENLPKSGNLFEALNFQYTGPVDGHNLEELILQLERMKTIEGPKLLHVVTTKGKGLKQAEENQVTYHAPGKFDAETGKLKKKDTSQLPSKYQDVFGKTLVELAENNKDIIGITPAMPTGSSLKFMMEAFPDRAFDVGIAEQHAVTLAAGLATQGKVVFCNIYSTFLQRGYDQVIHDVCLQNLPVIFCLDRAGIVGEDGATHHGIFDLAYLNCIPNLIIAAPSSLVELRNLLYTAQTGLQHPIAIRYPRGRGHSLNWKQDFSAIPIGKGRSLKYGKEVAVLSLGSIANKVSKAIDNIENSELIGHYDMRFLKPIDESLLHKIAANYPTIISVEDGVKKGGFGSTIAQFLTDNGYTNTLKVLGIPDVFLDHGTVDQLHEQVGLSTTAIQNEIEAFL